MTTADSIVRARIDTHTKERATAALEAMGLSVSDAIRLFMVRVADEGRLPFEVRVPSRSTIAAMEEIERGEVTRVRGAKALLAKLKEDDE